MTKALKALLVLLLLLSAPAAPAENDQAKEGQESHGGAVFEINNTVRVLDSMENSLGFIPSDLPEYRDLIKPRLEEFKAKLPKLGAYLQRILSRGINPRWYFVEFPFAALSDQGGTHLALTYQRKQIAINDDGIIQIDRNLWKRLPAPDRAVLLVHEALWSAVGEAGVKPDSGDSIRKLSSLLLDALLTHFTTEEVSQEVSRRAAAICARLKECPLYNYAQAIWLHNPVPGWQDVSTEANNSTPTVCRSSDDHCVYQDEKTELFWSPPMAGAWRAGTLEEAKAGCGRIKGWGGIQEWRLPSMAEFAEGLGHGLLSTLTTDPAWFPAYSHMWSASEDPGNWGWVVELATVQKAHHRKAARAPWVCVAGNFSKVWRDSSVTPAGAPRACSDRNQQCVFTDLKTGLQWSQILPGQVPRRKEAQSDWASADRACRELGSWGNGRGDWELPKKRDFELAYDHGLLRVATAFYDGFGPLEGPLWTSENAEVVGTPLGFEEQTAPPFQPGQRVFHTFDLFSGEFEGGSGEWVLPVNMEFETELFYPKQTQSPVLRGWLCVRRP